MKFNAKSHTLFLIIVMVAVFPSLTFAPWSLERPPGPPEDPNFEMTCEGWLYFNGFTDDYKQNVKLARRRNSNLDRYATTWAAIYAFQIDGKEDIYSELYLIADELLPPEFCSVFGEQARTPHRYLAIKDERKTCKQWVLLYRFTENDVLYNTIFANNIFPVRTAAISFWAYFYWQAIINTKIEMPYNAEQYCELIGQQVGDEAVALPYLTQVENHYTCRAWLRLFHFKDNPVENLARAETLVENKTAFRTMAIQWFPLNYAKRLVRNIKVNEDYLEPERYCEFYKYPNGGDPLYDLFYKPQKKRILR